MVHCWLEFLLIDETATSDIYTLSLHDALPIFEEAPVFLLHELARRNSKLAAQGHEVLQVTTRLKDLVALCCELAVSDRKSTRLNSSHTVISYAVFCLKKKKYEWQQGAVSCTSA